MNTKTKGSIGELLIMTQAVQRGYTVCVPYGDNQRYDLLLERNNEYIRVQVKCLEPIEGRITLATWTVVHNKDQDDARKYSRVRYNSKDVDMFAVVNARTHEVYMIPVNTIEHLASIILRTDRTIKYRKCNTARWADEYTW
jgi:hypothetical protein